MTAKALQRLFLGWFIISIPLSGVIWWIFVVKTKNGSQFENVALFLKPYPEIVSSPKVLTILFIYFSLCSIGVIYKNLETNGTIRTLTSITIGISTTLIVWFLFTLM